MKVTEFWIGKEAVKDDEASLDMGGNVLKLLQQAVGLNTTGTVYKQHSASELEISGSPTEKAILSWAFYNLDMNIEEVKKNNKIDHPCRGFQLSEKEKRCFGEEQQ
jgi:Ca2+-transporting ATPase